MRNNLISISIGAAMLLGGLALALLAPDGRLAVIELPKLGVVLAVLGAIELAISGWALAGRETRRREEPL